MSSQEVQSTYNFSGAIAENYEEFLGPLFFEPYAIEVASRIDPTSVQFALELASGTGRVTRHLRQRLLKTAKLIASDVSEDMMAIAKRKLEGLSIDWQLIDAQELPFGDSCIDLVVCCFGYMFPADKAKAFAEAYRVLKPGGMLLITTWDKLENNALSYIYRSTARPYLDDPLPASYNLPFSLHDENQLRKWMNEAGFSKIQIEKVSRPSVSDSAEQTIKGMAKGGAIYEEIIKRDPALMNEIIAKAVKELSEKYGASPMIAPMSAFISRSWK
jgi:ubiquinone/menaquinone biosynthesis C-methylase UbiE